MTIKEGCFNCKHGTPTVQRINGQTHDAEACVLHEFEVNPALYRCDDWNGPVRKGPTICEFHL